MNKSSFQIHKAGKSEVAQVCMLLMVAGFLVSRAVLSISVVLFGINALRGVNPRHWLRQRWWLAGVCWVAVYALTWFWTTDKANWGVRLEVKLPILLLPLAFACLPRFTAKQLQLFTVCTAVMLVASACYSVSFFISDPVYYMKEYHRAHLLPTLPKNDYIRSSITMALFIAWSFYAWPFLTGRAAKWLVGVSVVALAAFIHILAAKSGLLSLYLFLGGYGLYTAFTRNKLAGLAVILTVPLLVFIAGRYMPTFAERGNYISFTYFKLVHGDRSGDYGDIDRLMSYDVAAKLIRTHPLSGVGAGDMLAAMKQGYALYFPSVQDEHILLPHNQFLIVALGCGLPAALLFIVWVFMPLASLKRNRQSFFFFAAWLIALVQLLIEPELEIQFGVFAYLFFPLLLLHELAQPAEK